MNQFVITKWTEKKFRSQPANLDFTWAKDWPLHHLPIAWCWELDRELGSGNPPFIIAWKKKYGDAKPVEEIEPAARFLQLEDEELRELYPFNPDGYRYNIGLPKYHTYAVKINLRRTEDEILADLKAGIKKFKRNISSLKREPTRGKQRKDFIAWFRDLAIYRMSVAEIPSKKQMGLLSSEIITPKKIRARRGVPTKGETLDMSFANWNHKRDATIKRIWERLRTLYQLAELSGVGQDKNPRPNWNDNFIDLEGW